MSAGARRAQKRVLDSPEAGVAVRRWKWMLETEPRSSERAAFTLNHRTISPTTPPLSFLNAVSGNQTQGFVHVRRALYK